MDLMVMSSRFGGACVENPASSDFDDVPSWLADIPSWEREDESALAQQHAEESLVVICAMGEIFKAYFPKKQGRRTYWTVGAPEVQQLVLSSKGSSLYSYDPELDRYTKVTASAVRLLLS